MTMDIDQLLGGPGAPNAFPEGTPVGTKISGRITNASTRRQTTMAGEPLFWGDGSPRMELIVTLATPDGDRRLFAKGNMLRAIKGAVKASGAKLLIDGTLEVTRTGKDEPKNPGFKGAWTYEASYVPPAPGIDVKDL